MLNAIFKHVELKNFSEPVYQVLQKSNFIEKYQNKFENCTFYYIQILRWFRTKSMFL
jgi:hypothetical protein